MNLDQDTLMKYQEKNKLYFMGKALEEAKKAYLEGEIPVGAVVVKDNKIISKAHNRKEKNNNVSHHAEILAITKASKKLGSWRLNDCDIYVTLEPCSMCAGAIIQSRIRKLYYGTTDLKMGAVGSIINLLDYRWNHQVEYENGVMANESKELLKDFFKELRKS